jgi:predicted DNA-binding transcriptional regulator YafY
MQQLTKSSEAILTHAARSRAPEARAPIERMAIIYQALLSRQMVNARAMAEMIETSSRTILRDIEFMRDRLCLPIEYDQRRFTFVYGGEL